MDRRPKIALLDLATIGASGPGSARLPHAPCGRALRLGLPRASDGQAQLLAQLPQPATGIRVGGLRVRSGCPESVEVASGHALELGIDDETQRRLYAL